MPVPEANVTNTADGAVVESDGWFVVNVADARWRHNERSGSWCSFEGDEHRFERYGINVQVVEPGVPNCLYHAEDEQESLLVLAGELILLVEEQERRLKAWDFVHFPPDTRHVVVGAGNGPCAFLMAGTRTPDAAILYPASEVAARHGAAAPEPTHDPREAYGEFPETTVGRMRWPISGA